MYRNRTKEIEMLQILSRQACKISNIEDDKVVYLDKEEEILKTNQKMTKKMRTVIYLKEKSPKEQDKSKRIKSV